VAQGQPALNMEVREALFAKLHERILGLATYFGCGDLSKDVAQETMLVLASRYAPVQSSEDLVKLANAICYNISRAVLRRQYSQLAGPFDENRHSWAGPDPAVLAIDGELRARLGGCMSQCSRRCKALFRLDLDEAETERICRELKLSRSAVFTLRSRCLTELREIWWGRR
jgi:DNA-directed RNA polymerase specialized sigma24 family protein